MIYNEPEPEINEIIHSYPAERQYALAILQDLQKKFGYIPRNGLKKTALYLSNSEAHLYSISSFYKSLSFIPKGKHRIKLCDGTTCHIKSSLQIRDEITQLLGIKDGETTEDRLFSLEIVNCIGTCAAAPAMLIDETYYGKLTPSDIAPILNKYRANPEQTS
ncbi:MAG TPA: NAD(P)H-dependent oxidoreductase subunit E [Methanocorpusculum sp.]|nr:NAD(P)H-dependent oxidoreductase subunit E [Methanocorpusculum sp.]